MTDATHALPVPIDAPDAPRAIGPYAHAVRSGELVFLSGQIALDPASGALVQGDVALETQRVLDNLAAVLAAAGLGVRDLVRTTIYLVDLGDFAVVNDLYGRFLAGHRPARSTIGVAQLPRGARVEIDAIARAPG